MLEGDQARRIHAAATDCEDGAHSTLLELVDAEHTAAQTVLAGHPLGLRFRVLEPGDAPPAAAVAEHVQGALDDPQALQRFEAGIEVERGAFPPADLLAAEEAFLTSSVRGILPIASIDETRYSAPGAITETLRRAYEKITENERA